MGLPILDTHSGHPSIIYILQPTGFHLAGNSSLLPLSPSQRPLATAGLGFIAGDGQILMRCLMRHKSFMRRSVARLVKGLCAARVRVRVQRGRSTPHGGALNNSSGHQLPFLLVDLCVDILNSSSLDNKTLPANATSSVVEFWEYVITLLLFRLLSHPKAAAVGVSGWRAVRLCKTK